MRTVAVFLLNVVDDALELVSHHHREVAFRKFLAQHPDVIVHAVDPPAPPD